MCGGLISFSSVFVNVFMNMFYVCVWCVCGVCELYLLFMCLCLLCFIDVCAPPLFDVCFFSVCVVWVWLCAVSMCECGFVVCGYVCVCLMSVCVMCVYVCEVWVYFGFGFCDMCALVSFVVLCVCVCEEVWCVWLRLFVCFVYICVMFVACGYGRDLRACGEFVCGYVRVLCVCVVRVSVFCVNMSFVVMFSFVDLCVRCVFVCVVILVYVCV